MIVASGLHKAFGDGRARKVAVESISFSAPNAAVTGLLGPNGAGKTTTLRLLAGLLKPNRGRVSVGGHDLSDDALAARLVTGVLPDADGLSPRLTAREEIAYSAELHGLSGSALAERVDQTVREIGLGELAERRTEGFSRGERRKVALARALVHQPSDVLLDEPTNGLDVLAARSVRELIRALSRQGRCVLLSTHLMQEAALLCDRIVVVARGRVVAEGTPDELVRMGGGGTLEDAFVKLIGSEEGLG